jgi:hypothetical protein
VDHLGDLGQAPVARTEAAIGADGTGEQQNDPWAQALATGSEQVFSGSLKNGMACADQATQIGQEGIEVGLDRLEQLCNRGHDTSAVA